MRWSICCVVSQSPSSKKVSKTAIEIAFGQSHENRRLSSIRSFSLQGIKYRGDKQPIFCLVKILLTHYFIVSKHGFFSLFMVYDDVSIIDDSMLLCWFASLRPCFPPVSFGLRIINLLLLSCNKPLQPVHRRHIQVV